MGRLIRDGVALFCEDAGSGAPPLVFIHGLGSDPSGTHW
jgi:pimeloyl-ACP methyl ester carboxylesterase